MQIVVLFTVRVLVPKCLLASAYRITEAGSEAGGRVQERVAMHLIINFYNIIIYTQNAIKNVRKDIFFSQPFINLAFVRVSWA